MLNRLLAPILAALVLVPLASGCVDATIQIENDSSYTVDEIYLTRASNSSWGSDELGGQSLFPGESITIGVSCDYYDLLLIDETGAECELYDQDLCANDALLVLTNNTCTVFGAKKAPAETLELAPATTATL